MAVPPAWARPEAEVVPVAALIHLRIDGAEVTDRRMTLRRRSDAGRVLPASTVATQRLVAAVAAVVAPAAGLVPAAVVVPAPGRPGRPAARIVAAVAPQR